MSSGKAIASAMASQNTTKTIVYGVVVITALGLVYFGILRPILNKVGVTRDKDDRMGDRAEGKLSRRQVLSPTLYKNNPKLATITSGRANQLATQIYEGKGTFYDDEDMAVGGITGAGTKVNISRVADQFNKTFSRDLHAYLDSGTPSYLESEHWTQIDNYIDKIPKS